MANLGKWAAAVLLAGLAGGGCISVSSSKPLVNVERSSAATSDYPDTQIMASDTPQVRDLKTAVAQLRQDVAELQDRVAQEKAKRKAAEKQADQLKDQIKHMR